jgi:hypothetical protein
MSLFRTTALLELLIEIVKTPEPAVELCRFPSTSMLTRVFVPTSVHGNSSWIMTCIPSKASSRSGEHPEALYFKVRATNGKRYLLRWHEQTDEWFLNTPKNPFLASRM